MIKITVLKFTVFKPLKAYPKVPPNILDLIKEVGGHPFRPLNFWEGVSTTCMRAMSIGITKMACYNEIKVNLELKNFF